MGDTLKYRIPGFPEAEKNGKFKVVDSFDEAQGFVVSTFDKSERFQFIESKNDASEIHFNSKTPFVADKAEYIKDAEEMLQSLKAGKAHKAILSRIAKSSFKSSPVQLFDALCENYPNAFVYLISSELFGTWIGASPEVLLSSKDGQYLTYALAGTKVSGQNSEWSSKEHDEQKFVESFIKNVLESSFIDSLSISKVKTVSVGPVEHLRTDFTFETSHSERINIVERLHPTPAISGFPRHESLELINRIESHERSLYAGIIGDMNEDLSLFVNLRCAQIIDSECFLYLGGGFTKDSDPEKEWIETENKAKTLLNIIEKL